MRFTGLFLASGLTAAAAAVVPGVVFDRFVQIWLENVDFADAVADPSLSALAKKGIELTNYFGLTHPSQPNYVASVGGDYFGMDSDDANHVPANVSSIVDLLDDKGISWGEYQEDMPSAGFTGTAFTNPKTGANDYVRKHNPLITYDSVSTNAARSAKIETFITFKSDLAANVLPQWMFITPNMTNNGHDTSVTVAGTWSKNFLTPLLANPNFNTPKTLIVLTFDENENESEGNRVSTILLGGAVPASLVGTQDSNFYTHYSLISTIEANWGLHTLGRYDVGANVFNFVAAKTGDTVHAQNINKVELNGPYPGILNSAQTAPLPAPNTTMVINGRTVLPSIVNLWGAAKLQKCTVYTGQTLPPYSGSPPVHPSGC